MKRLNLFRFLLVIIIAPLFFVKGIYGYLTGVTNSLSNNFTISQVTEYTVTFEYNNTDPQTTRTVPRGQAVGTLPTVTYDDCALSTGNTYYERQCTYAYKFEGWFTDSNFTNQVDEHYIPSSNVTLYAKWNKVFYGHSAAQTFDGSNYIDTGVKLFSADNAHQNFIVTFVVDVNNGYNNQTGDRGSIFTDMDERAEPYSGVHFFTQGNTKYTMNINILGHKVKDSSTGYVTGQRVVIKKENGIVYYSYDNGPFIQINDFTSFNAYFDYTATFGAGLNPDGITYRRYFKGTLSDMSVEIFDTNTYTIHYDANGGTGMMIDQSASTGQTLNLRTNTFTYTDRVFVGWNTAANGTGTPYTDGQSVTDLTTAGNIYTLYAQWVEVLHYSVHFDANGGTGTMNDQDFTYGDPPVALTTNAFSKTGYMFMGWNTAADGSGTSYEDEELVQNLSNVQHDVVTLYAQYMRIAYSHAGVADFDGTSTNFIDTGVNLYSQANYSKDFEIRFDVTEVSTTMFQDPNHRQLTIINCKDESNPKYPGFNIRFNGTPNTMTVVYKWKNNTSSSSNLPGISRNNVPIHFVFKRTNGVVTIQYTYSGYDSGVITLFDQSTWQLDTYFPDNLSFGGIYNSSHNPDRFFIGKLSDMYVLLDD